MTDQSTSFRKFDKDGTALSLSGGGFKAAAYHVGALIRLNEVGVLPRLKRITSVSGGSIAAALLGLNWSRLRWQDGVASNLLDAFVTPLARFLTSAKIDISAGVSGILSLNRCGADFLEDAYSERLYGAATLQNLPDDATAPRFVILASNYQLNSLWRFSQAYAADYRVGMIRRPTFPLARIVAASSGFPPFFCPLKLSFEDHNVEPIPGADMHRPPYTEHCLLADGGIYDNMGIEPIWMRYGTLLISNAGDQFTEAEAPPTNWFSLLRRSLSMMHRQAENNRVRWLFEMDREGKRTVVYWPLRDSPKIYATPNPAHLSSDDLRHAIDQPVRLTALSKHALRCLVQHGYSMCDAAMRARLDGSLWPKPHLPQVEVTE